MIRTSLKARIALSFLFIIVLLSGIILAAGYFAIRKNVFDRSQRQIQRSLYTARLVYQNELDQMKSAFGIIDNVENPARLKNGLDLDYLYVIEAPDRRAVTNPIVARAFAGNANGGTRIIDSAELLTLGQELINRATIPLRETHKARPTGRTTLTEAMVIEYAAPIFDAHGTVLRVVHGGRLLNRSGELVERMHNSVFEERFYRGKRIGTATIFRNDVRIATNVLDKDGTPAIGTRVSAEVYDRVVVDGQPWYSRAFVVTDWYITAYEPIRDVNGQIVGILYVGTLEAPYLAVMHSMLFLFLLVTLGCMLLALLLSFVLAGTIARPISRLAGVADDLARGNLAIRAPTGTKITEIHLLAHEFNIMANRLQEREKSLTTANDELGALNKRYLDLVDMVAHELKGILASTMLNACGVRDGYYGTLSEPQATALSAVTRNLDYFDQTVKNFLSLSRIEKNELSLLRVLVKLRTDIVDEAVALFSPQAAERGAEIENLAPDILLEADAGLLQMAVNNLVGNAVRYGTGAISIDARDNGGEVTIEVFSEGTPIAEQDRHRLFQRFSRLDQPGVKRPRGTGLGLFITRQIAERQGGTVSCQARKNGNSFIITLPAAAPSHIGDTPESYHLHQEQVA